MTIECEREHLIGQGTWQTELDVDQRRAFLEKLGVIRNVPMRHCEDTLADIEPAILPLVRALDSPLTTPIYSCEGHWERRCEPYVTFVVLPGRKSAFNRFVSTLMETTPLEYAYMVFRRRMRPARLGNGPFIDWQIRLDVAKDQFDSAEAFEGFQDMEIGKYAAFLKQRFQEWCQTK